MRSLLRNKRTARAHHNGVLGRFYDSLLVFLLFIFHCNQGILAGKVDSALAVDVSYLDQNLVINIDDIFYACLLYTSDAADD